MLGEIRAKMQLILHPPELESEHDSQSGSLVSDFFLGGGGGEGGGGLNAKAAGKPNILGELQGNQRLAAWHRQQLFTPNPTAIEFAASFDPRIAPLWSPYGDPNKPATRGNSPSKGTRGASRGGSPGKAGSAAGARTGTSEARKSPSQRAKEKLEQQQNEESAMMRGTISLDCFVYAKDLVLANRDDDRVAEFDGGKGTKAGEPPVLGIYIY